jgi:hypothetical protein
MDIHSASFNRKRFNAGFTPEMLAQHSPAAAYQRLTMRAPRSLKINATGQNARD